MTVMNEIDTPDTATIIKTDTRGRARHTAKFKAEVVDACEKSGMSVLAFSRHCGVNYATLQSWIKKKSAADAESSGERFVLAELVNQSTAPGGVVKLELPGGACASAADENGVRLLAVLVRELAR